MKNGVIPLEAPGLVKKSNGGEKLSQHAATVSAASSMPSPILPGAVIGRIVAIQAEGAPEVDFPANVSGRTLAARSVVPVSNNEVGREVALIFEDGDGAKPIILGILERPCPAGGRDSRPDPIQVEIEKDSLIFSAAKEIVLRCGKSSITLTKAGKVLLRGAYLLSRSSGVNRIKGGSVEIN
jgi:hypothetical protein